MAKKRTPHEDYMERKRRAIQEAGERGEGYLAYILREEPTEAQRTRHELEGLRDWATQRVGAFHEKVQTVLDGADADVLYGECSRLLCSYQDALARIETALDRLEALGPRHALFQDAYSDVLAHVSGCEKVERDSYLGAEAAANEAAGAAVRAGPKKPKSNPRKRPWYVEPFREFLDDGLQVRSQKWNLNQLWFLTTRYTEDKPWEPYDGPMDVQVFRRRGELVVRRMTDGAEETFRKRAFRNRVTEMLATKEDDD